MLFALSSETSWSISGFSYDLFYKEVFDFLSDPDLEGVLSETLRDQAEGQEVITLLAKVLENVIDKL